MRRIRLLMSDISEAVGSLQIDDGETELIRIAVDSIASARKEQSEVVVQCRKNYQIVYEACHDSSASVEIVKNLQTDTKTEEILAIVNSSKCQLESLHQNFSKKVFTTLRRIAVLQTDIQFKLKRGNILYYLNISSYINRCGLDEEVMQRKERILLPFRTVGQLAEDIQPVIKRDLSAKLL